METNGTDGKGQAWDGMGWGRIDLVETWYVVSKWKDSTYVFEL